MGSLIYIKKPKVVGSFVIERAFKTVQGYYGVCVFNGTMHRCGYVGVTEGHPLYGIDSDSGMIYEFSCHGGVTYVGKHDFSGALPNNLWFVGFDCGHGMDLNDYGAGERYGITQPAYKNPYHMEGAEVRTLSYVTNEVRQLSAQMTPEAMMQRALENS